MIDISSVQTTVASRLKKLAPGQGLDLRTYKRDRSVAIIRQADGKLLIRQDGFEQREFVIPGDSLKKTLKALLKAEFPRSNKVRVYTLE